MPGPSKRRDDLAGDGFLAGGAHALLRRPHALLVHVLAQVAEHRVQVGVDRLVLLLLHLEVAEGRHEVVELLGARAYMRVDM